MKKYIDALGLAVITILLCIWIPSTPTDRVAGSFIVGGFTGAFIREILGIKQTTTLVRTIWIISFIAVFAIVGYILP